MVRFSTVYNTNNNIKPNYFIVLVVKPYGISNFYFNQQRCFLFSPPKNAFNRENKKKLVFVLFTSEIEVRSEGAGGSYVLELQSGLHTRLCVACVAKSSFLPAISWLAFYLYRQISGLR